MSHVDPMTAVHGSKSPLKTGQLNPTQIFTKIMDKAAQSAPANSTNPNNPYDAANAAVAASHMETKWLWIAGAALTAWYFLAP